MEGKKVKQHSLLGVASFTAAIITVALVVILLLGLGMMYAADPQGYDQWLAGDGNDPLTMLVGFIYLGLIGVALVALGLGIGGLRQKDRDKKFAVIGTVISSLVALGGIFLMILGSSM